MNIMKICVGCCEEKNLNQFVSIVRVNSIWYSDRCKQCSLKNKKEKKANEIVQKVKIKKIRIRNSESRKLESSKYYAKTKEKQKSYSRKYHENNKEIIAKKNKIYCDNNPEMMFRKNAISTLKNQMNITCEEVLQHPNLITLQINLSKIKKIIKNGKVKTH